MLNAIWSMIVVLGILLVLYIIGLFLLEGFLCRDRSGGNKKHETPDKYSSNEYIAKNIWGGRKPIQNQTRQEFLNFKRKTDNQIARMKREGKM